MKKIVGYLSLALSVVYLNSCDKISGDHFQPACAIDTNYTFPADTTANVYRVLMEDYTGHTCGNCPAAARDLYNNIVPIYGNKLVTIGVHANFFAVPCPPHPRPPGSPSGSYSDDFRTPAGEAWYTFFQLYSNPLGMVNRKDYPNNQLKTESNWNTEIASIINDAPQVKIRVRNIYNSATQHLETFTETKFLAQLSGNYNINVVLTEDSIVTWQLDDADSIPNVPNYIERHVMRGSINGNFGEQINTSSTTNAGTTFLKAYCTTLSSDWNVSHLHVVVFIFNSSTYLIYNVAEEPVIE